MEGLLKAEYWDLKESREKILKNTFILALDGDVDFKLDAVEHLLDGMERSENVAASCGRIHPIGSGKIILCNCISNE